MPGITQRSALLAKYGGRLATAVEAHKNDETDLGNMDLPAGIEGGIAQLVECRFQPIKAGKQNAGEYIFYAAGVVKMPVEHNGLPIQGLRTQISEPLFDTPTRSRKTTKDHIAWILNSLRKLGVDTTGLGAADLEATCAALKEQAPHFRFRTWKGSKQTTGQYANQEPRTNHDWNGVVEYADDESAGGGMEDSTGANGNGVPPRGGKMAPAAEEFNEFEGGEGEVAEEPELTDEDVLAESEGEVTEEEAGEGEEAPDLDALAAAADAQDKAAAKELGNLALAAGVSREDIKNAKDWAAVVALMQDVQGAAAATGEETEEEAAEEEVEAEEEAEEPPAPPVRGKKPALAPAGPQVGEVYKYRPLDPKTKKPAVHPKTKKPIFHELDVKAVDRKTKTVSALDLETSKLLKGIPWAALSD